MPLRSSHPFKALNDFIAVLKPTVHGVEFDAFNLFAFNLLSELSGSFHAEHTRTTWTSLLPAVWEAFKSNKAHKPHFITQEVTDALGVFPKTVLQLHTPQHRLGPYLLSNLLDVASLSVQTFLHATLHVRRGAHGKLQTIWPFGADKLKHDNKPIPKGSEDVLTDCYVVVFDGLLEPSEALALQEKIALYLETLSTLRTSSVQASAIFESFSEDVDVRFPKDAPLFQLMQQKNFVPLSYVGSNQRFASAFLKAAHVAVDAVQKSHKKPVGVFTKHLLTPSFLSPHLVDQLSVVEKTAEGKTIAHTFLGYSRQTLFVRDAPSLLDAKLSMVQSHLMSRYGLSCMERVRVSFEGIPLFVAMNLSSQDIVRLVLSLLSKEMPGYIGRYKLQHSPLLLLHVVIPRDTEVPSQSHLARTLQKHFSQTCVFLSQQDDRLQTSFYFVCEQKSDPVLKDVEEGIKNVIFPWPLQFKKALKVRVGNSEGERVYQNYGVHLPEGYAAHATPVEAVEDILLLTKNLQKCQLKCRLSHRHNKTLLKIYHAQSALPLSRLVPVLNHMGLHVDTEVPFRLPQTQVYGAGFIHFLYLSQVIDASHFETLQTRLEETVEAIFYQEAESDAFHRLIIDAGLTWQECRLLRALAKYLRQINVPYSDTYIQETFLKYPDLVRQLIQFFHGRLRPHPESLQKDVALCGLDSPQLLRQISDIPHHDDEHVLRCFFNLIGATLRTNFYQMQNDQSKNYLSLKFDCRKIEGLPHPKPLFEIFVYASFMEGVHLRNGTVARGGLRWSDRKEDYRKEILGLMKTQVVKNAIIVPQGAKGGFISKTHPLMLTPPDAYSVFIKGLLDVTDNYVKDKVVHPSQITCCDGEDPYLVVAADKGTATRSNDANCLAESYNFWLGDAFASGGLHGYDHKKMGITAKGAWKSVEHHFHNKGVSLRKPFTVVGVGDMSGDVFGNGMLLSRKILLKAAFDHRHIFLDPSPDPSKSYHERKRLFQKERSSWMDYNPELISKGGGVFERNARSIKVSKEIKRWLSLEVDTISPHMLMQSILKAPVDLLWFGGIGTFVKSRLESNLSIADRANDAIRVNGSCVRARVIAEGANLGVTERGRAEYALLGGDMHTDGMHGGGALNTDAIDNAAGVTCSDYEVNIKILFARLVLDGELTFKARNQILKENERDVESLVLSHNVDQNNAIHYAYKLQHLLFEEHIRLMHALEAEGLIERSLDGLPSEDALQERRSKKIGFVRPEIATLLGYAKISIKKALSNGTLLAARAFDDGAFKSLLHNYFPHRVRMRFENAIGAHPLSREIAETCLTNHIVNTYGLSFIHNIHTLNHAPLEKIITAVCLVQMLLGDRDLSFPATLLQEENATFSLERNRLLMRLAMWFLRHEALETGFYKVFENYKAGFDALMGLAHKQDIAKITVSNDQDVSWNLSLFFAPDIIQIQQMTQKPLTVIAHLHAALGQKLGTFWMHACTQAFSADASWQQKALMNLKEQAFFIQQQLAVYIITNIKAQDGPIFFELWCEKEAEKLLEYEKALDALKMASEKDMSVFVVLIQELQRLYEKVAGMCVKTVGFA